MAYLFNLIFFQPLYNALVLLAALLPGHSIGLAIVLLTVVVKLALLPLQWRMMQTQAKMKALEPTIKEIKQKHAKDKAEQARQIMNLHREHKINPLGGFLMMLIQLPIIIALYLVFQAGFNFDPTQLYSFVIPPPLVSVKLFGWFDLTAKSYLLAILAGLAQMIQAQLTIQPPARPAVQLGQTPTFQDDLARSMNIQIRYVLPIMIVFFAINLPSAIAIYWITSSLFTVVAELYFRRFKIPAGVQRPTK